MSGNKIGLLGVPDGSLALPTGRLLRMCGIPIPEEKGRKYLFISEEFFPFDGLWVLRPQDVPLAVSDGKVVAGFSGMDWLIESGLEAGLFVAATFPYSKAKMEAPKIVVFGKSGQKFHDTKKTIVYTEYPTLARRRFKNAKIVILHGATEGWVVAGENDFCVDLLDQGETAKANDLVSIGEPILVSPTILVVRKDSPFMEEINLFAKKLETAFASLVKE